MLSERRIHFKIISLPGSARRPTMAGQFDSMSFEWSFFDGLTHLPDAIPYNERIARGVRGRYLESGELGCFASHYSLWSQLASDDKADAYIVLEDDVIINRSFFEVFVDAFKKSEFDFHYTRFYAKVPVPVLRRKPFLDRFIVKFGEIAFGTQAYYIDKIAAAAYLESIKEVRRPIDDEMDRSWAHGVPNLCVFPHPVFEVQGVSTIQAGRRQLNPPKGLDRFYWIWTRVVEKARKLKYRFFHRSDF